MDLATVLGENLQNGQFWTHAWSLVEGCTPASPGCNNCWLASITHRFETPFSNIVSNRGFTGMIRLRDDRLQLPLRARKPRVYAIWSDFFHESVSPDFKMRALAVMALARQHYFIIVTKRAKGAVDFLQGPKGMWRDILSHKAATWFGDEAECQVHNTIEGCLSGGNNLGWPLSNVTILVTMEDQQRADERAPDALQLAAQGWRVGALCEPLLGPVNLNRIFERGVTEGGTTWGSWESCINGKRFDVHSDRTTDGWPRLHWVITGGESGHGARPSHPDWFRALRDQAQSAGVPFMFKQWGEWVSVSEVAGVGLHHYFPDGATVRRIGKKGAGRTLDGRELLELPVA